MDSPRGSNLDNGKSPTPPVGFRPQNGGIIKVQPPRREDLQPSYAQTLQGDNEAETHGWYGSMSMYWFCAFICTAPTNAAQSIPWEAALVSWVPSPAALSAPTPTSLCRRVTWVWSPSSVAFLELSTLVWSRSTHCPNDSSKSMSRSRLSRCHVKCA